MKKSFLFLLLVGACDKDLARPAPVVNPGSFDDAAVITKEEYGALETATAALDRNDAPRALELLAEHRKQYPNSVLDEVRVGLELAGKCMEKKTDEKPAARRYLLQYPGSALTTRLWSACGLDPR
jgi:hypothetical protein